MSEWYERAYPGGTPDVKHPLPRPLYPPDASKHDKQPSSDGPDILAWKRSLSRGQRWKPWDPDSWDDSFNNNFSHGRGTGNVGDSGVAGFQRQMDIDDTGWVGQKSWDALRYALVPDGFPHSGEHLIDGVAQQLFEEAWLMFDGHEPDTSTGTVRQAALKLAVSQIGVKESPPDSNQCKYTNWYGMVGPWCAMFVTWCYETNSVHSSPSFQKGVDYAYVPYLVGDARNNRNGLKVVGADNVIPGDLVCYDWDWNGEYDHIGIFEKWQSDEMLVIEGNTSTSNNSNGGQVMRRDRLPSTQATLFVRVAEP